MKLRSFREARTEEEKAAALRVLQEKLPECGAELAAAVRAEDVHTYTALVRTASGNNEIGGVAALRACVDFDFVEVLYFVTTVERAGFANEVMRHVYAKSKDLGATFVAMRGKDGGGAELLRWQEQCSFVREDAASAPVLDARMRRDPVDEAGQPLLLVCDLLSITGLVNTRAKAKQAREVLEGKLPMRVDVAWPSKRAGGRWEGCFRVPAALVELDEKGLCTVRYEDSRADERIPFWSRRLKHNF